MRDLAFGPYSHAQVLERMHDPNMRFRSSYDVLDESLTKIGELSTVSTNERAVVVEHNVDQAVGGSLDIEMDPDPLLDQPNTPLRRYIKPWQHYEMPDGGWVRYPWGVFVWVPPNREILGRGVAQWKAVLPDQTAKLNMQGPPEDTGFSVYQGQLITDAIKDILSRVGITDFSGVQEHPARFDQSKTYIFFRPNTDYYFGRERVESQLKSAEGLAAIWLQIELDTNYPMTFEEVPVMWLPILKDFHESLAFWPPHFDWNGTYQGKTALDPTKLVPDPTLTYVSDDRSIMSEVKTEIDLGKFANRVAVRSTNEQGLWAQFTADLDDWMPGHPFARRQTGWTIPHYENESNVDDYAQLAAKAILQLFYMACTNDKAQFISHVNPAHEPYDLMGVQVYDDADLARVRGESTFQAILQPFLDFYGVRLPVATVPTYQEHSVSLDLNSVDQDHGGFRVYLPLQGFG